MIKGRLTGLSTYLAGPIDLCPLLGKEWRSRFEKRLKKEFGVKVYNPMDKPKGLINEDANRMAYLNKLKENEQYDEYSKEITYIRDVDRRMVARSDFIITNLDIDIYSCGTFEEIGDAAYADKPVLVVCKQGKKKIPGWLFAQLDHKTFFDKEDDLFLHLSLIHDGSNYVHMKGWLFF